MGAEEQEQEQEQDQEQEGQSSGGRKGDRQEKVLLGGAAPATPSAKVVFSVGISWMHLSAQSHVGQVRFGDKAGLGFPNNASDPKV